MDTAIANLLAVTAKSVKRDFAWNMIMWAAFKTSVKVRTKTDIKDVSGSMEFYSQARCYKSIDLYLCR